jgi:hypothetical protein
MAADFCHGVDQKLPSFIAYLLKLSGFAFA